jgi:hypothetical protein
VGVHGWDGSDDGVGVYEEAGALEGLFAKFGPVEHSSVRHRIQDPNARNPKHRGARSNTSWALVTMGAKTSVLRVLEAAESQSGIMAGAERLRVSRFDEGLAQASSRGMSTVMRAYQRRFVVKKLDGNDDVKLRHQVYSQIFYILDDDFSGSLDVTEISRFGEYAMGRDWDKKLARTFLDRYDTNDDKAMCLEEFSLFCEETIYPDKSVEFIESAGERFPGRDRPQRAHETGYLLCGMPVLRRSTWRRDGLSRQGSPAS